MGVPNDLSGFWYVGCFKGFCQFSFHIHRIKRFLSHMVKKKISHIGKKHISLTVLFLVLYYNLKIFSNQFLLNKG